MLDSGATGLLPHLVAHGVEVCFDGFRHHLDGVLASRFHRLRISLARLLPGGTRALPLLQLRHALAAGGDDAHRLIEVAAQRAQLWLVLTDG